VWGEEGEESRWGGEEGGEGRGGREGEASPIQSVFIVIKRTFWKVGKLSPFFFEAKKCTPAIQ
jgi:hypothetical protein